MLKELDGAEDVVEHPYLEPVQLPEPVQRDEAAEAGGGLESVRDRVEECEVFKVGRSFEAAEERVQVEHPLGQGE